MEQIAGIDGCQSRWLAIAHMPGSSSFTAQVLTTNELAAQPWTLAAIDIPIGLPDSGAREADGAARKFVGPRASSVFPCPIRPALEATSWEEACEITYQHNGHRISQQTFGILPKIRAVDECVRSTDLRQHLFEVHPEVSFASWQGSPMLHAKKDVRGHEQRRASSRSISARRRSPASSRKSAREAWPRTISPMPSRRCGPPNGSWPAPLDDCQRPQPSTPMAFRCTSGIRPVAVQNDVIDGPARKARVPEER